MILGFLHKWVWRPKVLLKQRNERTTGNIWKNPYAISISIDVVCKSSKTKQKWFNENHEVSINQHGARVQKFWLYVSIKNFKDYQHRSFKFFTLFTIIPLIVFVRRTMLAHWTWSERNLTNTNYVDEASHFGQPHMLWTHSALHLPRKIQISQFSTGFEQGYIAGQTNGKLILTFIEKMPAAIFTPHHTPTTLSNQICHITSCLPFFQGLQARVIHMVCLK